MWWSPKLLSVIFGKNAIIFMDVWCSFHKMYQAVAMAGINITLYKQVHFIWNTFYDKKSEAEILLERIGEDRRYVKKSNKNWLVQAGKWMRIIFCLWKNPKFSWFLL